MDNVGSLNLSTLVALNDQRPENGRPEHAHYDPAFHPLRGGRRQTSGTQTAIEVAAGGALPTGMVDDRGRRRPAAGAVATVWVGSPAHEGMESARRCRQKRTPDSPAGDDHRRQQLEAPGYQTSLWTSWRVAHLIERE